MDVGGFYARGPYSLPHTPMVTESQPIMPFSPDPATVSLNQKLDHIVTLVQAQSQETAAIRSELSSVKTEMASLQEKTDILKSSDSTPARKKIPSQLSVSNINFYDAAENIILV